MLHLLCNNDRFPGMSEPKLKTCGHLGVGRRRLCQSCYFRLYRYGTVEIPKQICEICGAKRTGYRFSRDHCATTGKRRGTLCIRCNTSLGRFLDNPERLREAARAVESNSNRICPICARGIRKFDDNPILLIKAAEYLERYA